MKLAVKSAGLCASSAFIITALPAFFQQVAPLTQSIAPPGTLQGMTLIETILFSLAGALVAGSIGYIIGDILANPQGNKQSTSGNDSDKYSQGLSETGNETFFSDLEPISAIPLPETLSQLDEAPTDQPEAQEAQ
jgi:hypothetical protein